MWKLHAAADDRRLRIVVEREAVSTAAVEYTVEEARLHVNVMRAWTL